MYNIVDEILCKLFTRIGFFAEGFYLRRNGKAVALRLTAAFLFQVDCALSLVRLGMERNIPGLLALCDDLVTLEALVYEAGCDLTLTLKELQQMEDIEKLRLLMNSVGVILTPILSIPCIL